MKRSTILFHGLLATSLLCAASSGRARGDEGDDERLARTLVTAASKSFEYDEAMARYGAVAQIAQELIQKREQKADLVVQIRNANGVIATFPQNRLRWLAEQWDVYNQKLAWDQQVTALNREIEELNLRQQQIYEAELEKARAGKRAMRPIRREAILDELRRLEAQSDAALAELKEGLDAAARTERVSRLAVWERVRSRVDNLDPRPEVPAEYLNEFIKRAARWLDGAKEPGRGKTKSRGGRPRRK